jgi:transcriptional regulator with XRE-family HTH domain
MLVSAFHPVTAGPPTSLVATPSAWPDTEGHVPDTDAISGTVSTLGDLLLAGRTAAGLTQQELADLSTVSVRTIRELESGRRRTARPATIRLLLMCLNVPAAQRAQAEIAAHARIAPVPVRTPDDAPTSSGSLADAGFTDRGRTQLPLIITRDVVLELASAESGRLILLRIL